MPLSFYSTDTLTDTETDRQSQLTQHHRRKLGKKVEGPDHGEHGARAYNEGLGAEPPAGSRAEPLVSRSGG